MIYYLVMEKKYFMELHKELAKGALKSIMKQAELSLEDFLRLL